jgi:hypothetical protein
MLKPIAQSQNFTGLSVELSSQSVVECKFPQSSQITEIIATYPQVSLLSCEVSSGRVTYGGRLILTVVYIDENGKLCRMQKGVEFSHYADDESLAPAQTATCQLTCEHTHIKRDGSSYVIAIVVGAKIATYSRSERNYVTECDGAVIKAENVNFFTAVPFSGESEVEDDFDADSVADVLMPSAKVLISSAQCRTGEVAVEGEIYLSLFALRGDLPICMDRVIPFKTSVYCEEAVVGTVARVVTEIKDLNVTASVDEDKGKCAINFVCDLALNGVFYTFEEVPAVVDAFALDNQLNITTERQSALICDDIKVYSERVSGVAVTKGKLDYTCNLRAVARPEAQFNYIAESGGVEGSINAVLIYEQGGEIKSTEIDLPFAITLNGVANGDQYVDVAVAVCGVTVKQRAEGEMEAEAVLKISATVSGRVEVNYVSTIEEGDAVVANDSAISVYLPTAGDDLWQLAKRLNRTPDDVVSCNPDLTFPLEGTERIVIYRRKLG